VLHGAYARGRLVRENTPEMHDEAETMLRLAELGWGKDDPVVPPVLHDPVHPRRHGRAASLVQRDGADLDDAEDAARFMREFNAIDVTALLPQVRCPTLVLHSRHDVRVPFEEGRLVAGAIPGARFVPIESSNHCCSRRARLARLPLDDVRAFLPAGAAPGAAPAAPSRPLEAAARNPRARRAGPRTTADRRRARASTDKTVRNQMTAIFDRLEVENRPQAIVLGARGRVGRRAPT
jgi:hypothetical protein